MVIKEYGPGNTYLGSKVFQPTEQGYAQARQEIERINQAGHYCKDDDSGVVLAYRP